MKRSAVVLKTENELRFMELLGARFQEYRQRLGYSLEEIADLMGASRSLIVHWEVGKSIISGPKMILMAHVLQIPWVEILKLFEEAHNDIPARA